LLNAVLLKAALVEAVLVKAVIGSPSVQHVSVTVWRRNVSDRTRESTALRCKRFNS